MDGDSPGDTESTFIQIVNDDLAENRESIDVQITSSEPRATFSVGGDTAVVNIMDDDPGE